MTVRTLPLLVLGWALASCKEEDDPFLPLPALCPQRTEAICAARSRGCEEGAGANCERDELARCDALREAFEAEAGLSYDSVAAARVRQEEQIALDEGGAPLPLARYFERGLGNDSECERDSQCETGFCNPETAVCETAPELMLCEPE